MERTDVFFTQQPKCKACEQESVAAAIENHRLLVTEHVWALEAESLGFSPALTDLGCDIKQVASPLK